MALTYEFLGQVGHDPFGPAVQLWGHTFPERRQLSDLHVGDPFNKRNMREVRCFTMANCSPDSN